MGGYATASGSGCSDRKSAGAEQLAGAAASGAQHIPSKLYNRTHWLWSKVMVATSPN